MSDDLYDLLQVSPDADQEFIDAAYRRMVRMNNPETSSDPDAEVFIEELTVAYETLSDPQRRAEYDRSRRLAELQVDAMDSQAGAYDREGDQTVQSGAAPGASTGSSGGKTSNPGRDLFFIFIAVVGTFAITLAALNFMSGTSAPSPAAGLIQSASAPTSLSISESSPVRGSPVAAAVTAPTSVPPAATATPAPVLLRLQFKPDDDRRYSYAMKFTAHVPDRSKTQIDMQMVIRYRVVEVHSDGSATVTATYEKMIVSANGRTEDLSALAGTGVRMRVAPDGSTSEVSAEGGAVLSDDVDLESLSQMMVYPAQPIGIGDAFSNKIRLTPAGSQPLMIDSRVTLEELTTIAGPERRRALVLKETTSMPRTTIATTENVKAEGQIGGEVAHYVDAETGWPIFGNGALRVNMSGSVPGQTGSVTMPMTIDMQYRLEQ